MKLKILPPTLRNDKRYISFEAISEISLTRDDVISLVWESSLNFHGECKTSKFDLWIMKFWKVNGNDKMIKGIIQCNRDEVDSVRAAILLINRFRGKKVVFHTLGISGTIKSAIKKFIKLEDQH
ncbi:Rpp14/Pop5 family protein [Methanobacterium sp. ACI-7]|uniref:Rpp14/Pop5 family protein n=1 Tax=unclassified Methanobacterium TaxID=2627676 RepID=UPI0039C4B4EB